LARTSLTPRWFDNARDCQCTDVQAAETIAIWFALNEVHRVFPDPATIEGLFVRTDNKWVAELVGAKTKSQRKHYLRRALKGQLQTDLHTALKGVFNAADHYGYELRVKHVFAHGRANDPTARWMNDQADRLANLRSKERQNAAN